MNMLLHGVKDTEFDIYHGDTLTNDWEMLRENKAIHPPAPAKHQRIAACLSSLDGMLAAGRGRWKA